MRVRAGVCVGMGERRKKCCESIYLREGVKEERSRKRHVFRHFCVRSFTSFTPGRGPFDAFFFHRCSWCRCTPIRIIMQRAIAVLRTRSPRRRRHIRSRDQRLDRVVQTQSPASRRLARRPDQGASRRSSGNDALCAATSFCRNGAALGPAYHTFATRGNAGQ